MPSFTSSSYEAVIPPHSIPNSGKPSRKRSMIIYKVPERRCFAGAYISYDGCQGQKERRNNSFRSHLNSLGQLRDMVMHAYLYYGWRWFRGGQERVAIGEPVTSLQVIFTSLKLYKAKWQPFSHLIVDQSWN